MQLLGYNSNPNKSLIKQTLPYIGTMCTSLQWRHNERDGISNHRRVDCLPFVQAQIKENIKASHRWPLWEEFTGDRWLPCTKTSNAENVPIWWHHYVIQFPWLTRWEITKMSTILLTMLNFWNYDFFYLIQISLKLCLNVHLTVNRHLIRKWLLRRSFDKLSPERCRPIALTHICVTNSFWVLGV